MFLSACRLLGYDWLQINGNPQHSGNNTLETTLGPSNVASLLFSFQATLPAVADGAPVYLAGVATPTGTRDLLFVTTRAGHLVALDSHTGASIWSRQYPAAGCISSNGGVCYTTSSPALDPNRLYVYTYGLDGYVHRHRVGDGVEVTGGGWPQLTTTKGFNEKGSSALAFATAVSGSTYLYVSHGGYPGDGGDYQGHVTAIDLATGAQQVFNSLCSDQAVHFQQAPATPDCSQRQSAVWARVGMVYDNVTDRIYVATGNGLYDASTGGHEWADSVFSLNPDGSGSAGKPLDSYTPTTFQQLQNADSDLGSTAPAILPAASFPGRLAVQGGKDAMLRLINLSNLSGQGGPGFVGGELQLFGIPQGCGMLTAPAVWINPADGSTWVFVTNGCGASGLKLTFPPGVPTLVTQWQNSRSGFSPLIANNVLYYAAGGVIRAVDPVTGNVLWSDTTRVGGIHWESPVVVNGVLYISDENAHLTAYTLGPTILAISPRFGSTAGGSATTLFGSGFLSGATVSFGGTAATGVAVLNATTIRATAPAHAAGTVDVSVTIPGPRTSTLTGGFLYGSPNFFSVSPCRLIDTRGASGPSGGPALVPGLDRAFPAAGQCGIPTGALAISANVTVTQTAASGFVVLFEGGTPAPYASMLNYGAGQSRANNAILPLGSAGDIVVHCTQPAGTAHLIVDVNGYFQ